MQPFKLSSKIFGLLFAFTSLFTEILLLILIAVDSDSDFYIIASNILAEIFLTGFFIMNIFKKSDKTIDTALKIYSFACLIFIFCFIFILFIDRELHFYYLFKSIQFLLFNIFILITFISKKPIYKSQKALFISDLFLILLLILASFMAVSFNLSENFAAIYPSSVFITLILPFVFILDIA